MTGPGQYNALVGADADEMLRCLERCVREEARAAAAAPSVEATLIHVSLASAYAKLFGEHAIDGLSANSWVQAQRVW
ncbi:MAG: hypothetical protein M3438_00905 [Pseudomonadota bacterium]|nr:hypothetical protein [Sphingomonas sp.]MDQ3477711.1 hypothetical protein [Pseudomonadota bacterium]